MEVIFLGKDNQFEEQLLGVEFRLRKLLLGGFLCNSWPALTLPSYGPTTCISEPSTRSTESWPCRIVAGTKMDMTYWW